MKKLLIYLLTSVFILACVKEEETEAPSVYYDLNITASDGGSVSSAGGSYQSGSTVTLTATADEGYTFSTWSNGATDNPLTISVNSNLNLTAEFIRQKYALTVNIVGEGEVVEEIVSTGKNTDYESGTTVRLTPVPDDQWAFYRWNNQIADTTLVKEIQVTEPTSVSAKFDYASGKKMIGQWKLGSENAITAKSGDVSATYFIVDYALNFYIVTSTDETIDQDEIDAAPYGMIDPTSPTEFNLNFGVINIPDYLPTQDVSNCLITMPSENFGSASSGAFDMNLTIGEKTVAFSVEQLELDLPLAEDGTIAPPTLSEDLTDNPEDLAILASAFVDELKESTMEVLQDDTLFPEVCVLEITSIELTSNNDDEAINCEEDIKVTVEFPRAVLAPVDLVMTDKDGIYESIGMTPVTDTPSSSIDLTSETFTRWEVNITRNGALNWIDVSTDNTVTLTVSHKCYTGSEALTYDLLEECPETETGSGTVSYQVRTLDLETYVTQDEENYGKVYCGDYLKFDVSLPEAHNGSVHLKLVYANEDEELITIAPVGSVPTTDWSIDTINLAEGNYGEVTAYVILDLGADNETWLINYLVLDYQEGLGCVECEDITSATLTSNNDDQDIECEEDIKVTIDFGEEVLAPVELIMTDKDGTFETIGMTPVTSTPSASIDLTTDTFSEWEVNISRSGALNWIDVSMDNTVTLTVSQTCYTGSEALTYDLLEECTTTNTASITYQVLSSDMETYVTQNEENYGKVYCGDNLKFDISLSEAHSGGVHLKLVYADGQEEFVTMAPEGSTPATDWTIDNISLTEDNYGEVTTFAVLDYTSTDEEVLSSDLVLDYQEGAGCVEDSPVLGWIRKYIFNRSTQWFSLGDFMYIDPSCRETNEPDIVYTGEKIRYYTRVYTELESLHFKVIDGSGTEEVFTGIPLDDNNNTIDNLYDPNPDNATTSTSFHWYFDYEYIDKQDSYTIEPFILDEEQSIYSQLSGEGVSEQDKVKLVHNVVTGEREEIIGGMNYMIQFPDNPNGYSLGLANEGPYGTIKTTDKLLFNLDIECAAAATEFKIIVLYPNSEEETIELNYSEAGGVQGPFYSNYTSSLEGWSVNTQNLVDDAGEITVTFYKNATSGAPNTKIWQVLNDPTGMSYKSDNEDLFIVPGVLSAKINVIPGLFQNECEDITSATLTSNNDDQDIECEEDIKVTIDFGEEVLAPVELIMTDKDGTFETIGMTPVTSTPSASIDLTTDTFSEWEVNISRSGALNWIDVSMDNTVTLTVSQTCYTGSEALTYDLLEECTTTNTASITYQVLSSDMETYVTQNEENYGKVYCGDNLKFDISLSEAHSGGVHLKLVYADGQEEFVTMAPEGSTPATDWTIDNISLTEDNYGEVTTFAVLDYTSTDEEVLSSDLVLDYQEGAGCVEVSYEATLEYQIKDLEGNWITQEPENYGTVNCDDILKINVVTESPQESLHFTFQDPEGIWNDLTMTPVGEIPTTEWTIEEVSLGDKYGEIQTYVTYNIGTEDQVSMNEIIINYQACEEALISAQISYQILELGTENYITQDADSYGTIFCDNTLKVDFTLSEAQSGSVHLRVTYSDGAQQHISMAPDGDLPTANWTINNIKLSGAFGEAKFSVVVDYTSENEVVIGGDANELAITFNESAQGCD